MKELEEFLQLHTPGEMKTLEQLVEDGAAFAREYYRRHKEFPYVWYIQTSDGQFPVIAPEMPPGSKDEVAAHIRAMLRDVEAESYVFMAEAWMVGIDPKEHRDPYTIRPSNHPDRIEVLTVYGENSERSISGSFNIVREEGKPPTLTDFKVMDGTNLAGRFVNMLPSHSGTRH